MTSTMALAKNFGLMAQNMKVIIMKALNTEKASISGLMEKFTKGNGR